MILLIDAFNLIYKIDGLDEFMFKGELIPAMEGLKKQLSLYNQKFKFKHEIHLFFDGKKKNSDITKKEKIDKIYIYYSHDVSADFLIMEFIKRHRNPGNLSVVSSDKEIQHFARKYKCSKYTSEDFARILLSKEPENKEILLDQKTGNISKEELNYWENLFSERG